MTSPNAHYQARCACRGHTCPALEPKPLMYITMREDHPAVGHDEWDWDGETWWDEA